MESFGLIAGLYLAVHGFVWIFGEPTYGQINSFVEILGGSIMAFCFWGSIIAFILSGGSL